MNYLECICACFLHKIKAIPCGHVYFQKVEMANVNTYPKRFYIESKSFLLGQVCFSMQRKVQVKSLEHYVHIILWCILHTL